MSDSELPVLDHKIEAKSAHLIEDIHTRDLDIQSNHIYLFGREEYVDEGAEPGVEYLMANRFIRNVNIAMRANAGQPILVHMKSCGGDWCEGMAIYDMIKACPSFVSILSYTHARSMTSLIFQAADRRVMMPNSYFLFHEGTLGFEGNYRTVMSQADWEKRILTTMIEIYATRMKERGKFEHRSMKFIRHWLQDIMNKKDDVYMTPKEAVEYGFADEIFDYNWARLTQK